MVEMSEQFTPAVKEALGALSPRTRKIIEKRYGLFGKSPQTLEAIGQKEGITRERVRQIENDSLERVKASEQFAKLSIALAYLEELFNRRGGVFSEEHLSDVDFFGDVSSMHIGLFLLELADFTHRRKESEYFRPRWYHTQCDDCELERALIGFVELLKTEGRAYEEDAFLRKLQSHLARLGLTVSSREALHSLVHIAKHLDKNVWGEYGHISSPLVRPRGMKDEAFVALLKEGSPLHFTEIASRIGGVKGKKVHVQTVHNELIKDKRFVLVGRGLYALGEWGYNPGFVKDIIVSVLRNGPVSEDVIVKAVCAQRFVKKSTVKTNLQNKSLFIQLDDGNYSLIA